MAIFQYSLGKYETANLTKLYAELFALFVTLKYHIAVIQDVHYIEVLY